MTLDIVKAKEDWIYQSNKLVEASYTLTVSEQKLIRLLASMVKKDDEVFKEYEFKAKDLMKLFNTTNGRFYKDMDGLTDLLMGRVIKIKDKESQEWEKYHWVDVAKYKNGILKLKINAELKPFYLSLDWYTKYQLKNILQFKSTYSFRIYELLKQYESIKCRTISIEELRTFLDISKNEYPLYANLKQKVIAVALKEINAKTDLLIDFEEIKESRKIISVKFIISTNKINTAKEETTIEDPHKGASNGTETLKQVQAIFYNHKVTATEVKLILKDANNNIELIEKCYEYALSKNKIDNMVGYMRALVKGFNEPQGNVKVDSFNDIPQRKYDFEELEKKLLGWS